MRKILLTFFLCYSLFLVHSQNEPANYFSSKKNSEKDSINKTASKIGNYLSIGIGKGYSSYGNGFGGLLNYSFAFKSHLLTFSGGAVANSWLFGIQYYSANYISALLGESIRKKYYFLSVSAGISYSEIEYSKPNLNGHNYSDRSYFYIYEYYFPVELKIIFHYYHGFGIGFINTTLISKKGLEDYAGFLFVTGIWNKFKRR